MPGASVDADETTKAISASKTIDRPISRNTFSTVTANVGMKKCHTM
jgi:hypothetical protein